MGETVLSRALSGLDISSIAATLEGVNLVVGAAEARARSVRHALVVTLGKPVVAIAAHSLMGNYTGEIIATRMDSLQPSATAVSTS